MYKYVNLKIATLFVALLSLAGALVWITEKNFGSNPSHERDAFTSVEDDLLRKNGFDSEQWAFYANEELGVRFKYPKKWGEAREYDPYKNENSCLESGERRFVYFENSYKEGLKKTGEVVPDSVIDVAKSAIVLIFTSSDFSSCDIPTEEYRGDVREIQDTCQQTNTYVRGCRIAPNAHAPSVTYYQSPNYAGSFSYRFEKRAKISSPNSVFKGILIVEALAGFDDENKSEDVPSLIDKPAYVDEVYGKITRRETDRETLELIDGFDRMVESMEFDGSN